MYDLWYSFGTAIMSPGLLTRLQGLEPEFQLVTRTITETADPEPTGMYDPPLTDDTFAGVLDSDSTTDVRKAIWTYLTQAQTSPTRSIPPVSIYTAGKFCQLLNVPTTDFFEDIIANANAVYKDALGKPTSAHGGAVWRRKISPSRRSPLSTGWTWRNGTTSGRRRRGTSGAGPRSDSSMGQTRHRIQCPNLS